LNAIGDGSADEIGVSVQQEDWAAFRQSRTKYSNALDLNGIFGGREPKNYSGNIRRAAGRRQLRCKSGGVIHQRRDQHDARLCRFLSLVASIHGL
jgi:hypothetical protein